MNDIINDVENLKQLILKSEEYNNYNISKLKLDKNKEVIYIIDKIKQLQQVIINKEDKKQDTDSEEIELQSLYKKLETYDDYNEYRKNARIFNDLITEIQKKFENYFNTFII